MRARLSSAFNRLVLSTAILTALPATAETPANLRASFQVKAPAWHDIPFRTPQITDLNANAPQRDWPRDNAGNTVGPRYIVMHCTDGLSASGAVRTLTTTASAHYLVKRDGVILRIVPEDKAAWHAGKTARWEGRGDVDLHAIGIELVGTTTMPYTAAQLESVKNLVHDIQVRHGIAAKDVIAHSDVNTAERGDPGPFFPWKDMARLGIGIMPENAALRPDDRTAAKPETLRPLMTEIGYDPRAPIGMVVRKFKLHYDPQGFNDPITWNTPTVRTLRLAQSIAAQKRAPVPAAPAPKP